MEHCCKDFEQMATEEADTFYYNEADGTWRIVTRDDTEIPINHCPFCGKRIGGWQ